MKANDEHLTFENDVTQLYNGDEINISIERDDLYQESSIIISGYDPNVILDSRHDPESSLDEIEDEEEITFNNN